MIHAKTCPQCGQGFEHNTLLAPRMTYCSETCQRKAGYAKRLARGDLPRRCPQCGEVKPADEYSGRTHSYCKPCAAIYARGMRKREDPARRARYRRWETLGRYGLTDAQFEAMIRDQGGRCAICSTNQPGGSGVWHIDHDHRCCGERRKSCGKCVRGLLCSRCNIGLGNFGDDPKVLESAIAYLQRYRS